MNRPLARRRGGATFTTLGFLGVGGSFALLGGAGPWLLHRDVTSGLTLVMVVSSVFGFGVAAPIEQLVSRRLNAGGGGGSREPLRWLTLGGLVIAVVASIAVSGTSQDRLFHTLVPSIVVAIIGWVCVVTVRSRLAGAGDLVAYAAVLLVETGARLILIAAAVVDRDHDVALLGAAVGLPLLVAAGAAVCFRLPAVQAPLESAEAMSLRSRVGEQGAFVAVSFCYQICLNALTLVLTARGAAPHVVSAVGAANSYFLAPTVLMGGVTTHALVSLSHAWGKSDMPAFLAARRSSMQRGVATAVAATGMAVLAEPVALPFYYNHDLGLSVLLLGCMAVSTVITVVAVVAIQPLLAAGQGRPAAMAWMAGAVVTVIALGLSSGTNWLACLALVVGPAVALAGARWSVGQLASHRPKEAVPA